MVEDFGKRALSGRVHHVIKYVIIVAPSDKMNHMTLLILSVPKFICALLILANISSSHF